MSIPRRWLIVIAMILSVMCALQSLAISNAQGNLVVFPSPEIEFIIGPQLRSGDPSNPAPWFDENAIAKGLQHGAAFPASPSGTQLTGTVSVTMGSRIVEGTGTQFLTDFPGAANNYYVLITDGTGIERTHYLTSVQDATHLTLSVAWTFPSASGRGIAKNTGDAVDAYVNLNYYDQALTQYINYYRTGDVRFRDFARKIADSWWQSMAIDEGRRDPESSYAPRNVGLSGLMLRAMDGRPEFWPWITRYVREMFQIWVGARIDYPGLYFGVRDPGYSLLYAANLARVHPDATVRAEFREKALNAAKTYYARLQRVDGTWRWGDDAWIGDAMQGFHVGLLLEGLIQVHRLTGDAQVAQAIAKGVEGVYLTYNSNRWRGLYYQLGGAWSDGTNCATGCGAAALPFPPADISLIAEARQLNATVIHAFGYAFLITGDPKFKTWGDDIYDATYSGRDGFRGLAHFRAKEYNESYRSGGRYLAWRLSGGSSPSPTPSVSPSPTSTPTPVPSPTVAPTPQPTPPTQPCAMTVTAPVLGEWGSGVLNVTVSGVTQSTYTISAASSSGQITVTPPPQATFTNKPSAIAAFQLRAKKRGANITVNGPCGSQVVEVAVR